MRSRLDLALWLYSFEVMKRLRTYLFACFVILAALQTGCNTVKGLGEDFEAMGRSMQNAGD